MRANDKIYGEVKLPTNRVTFLFCVAAICSLSLFSTKSHGADFRIKPSLAVSAEFTDNVFDSHNNIKSDYITRVQPGVSFQYKAPLWDWDLSYIFDYSYYLNSSRGITDDKSHNINARGLVKIVDDVLFLELSDVYSRTSLDITRNATNESYIANQTDQNIGIVSPYLILHPTGRLTVKTGYRYINTWYDDPKAINKQDHVGFINSSYELSPKLFLTADYTFTREIPEANSSINRHEAYVGPRYEYADKSFIYAQGGFIVSDYDSGTHNIFPSWNAGLTHTFDTVTANIATGRRYSDDPLGTSTMEAYYSASLTKHLQRGLFTLLGSYTEYSDANADKLKTKRFSGGFTSSYEILQDLNGSLGFTYDNYREVVLHGTTNRYFVDCGLTYNFGRELTAGIYYKYIEYASAEIVEDNKQINRIIFEIKKVF